MDVQLHIPDSPFYIHSIDDQGIKVNHDTHASSVVIYGQHFNANWGLSNIKQLDKTILKELIDLGSKLIILGTGEQQIFPDTQLIAYCQQHGVGIEIMSTRQAAQTYNMLADEGRDVCAALIWQNRRHP